MTQTGTSRKAIDSGVSAFFRSRCETVTLALTGTNTEYFPDLVILLRHHRNKLQ
jgi:hypothetical protein